MTRLVASVALCYALLVTPTAAQIIAGSPEDMMFQRIAAESNPEAKLEMLNAFEMQFPQSKVLPDIYLMAIDLYRQKGDRAKVIEYGERTLKADPMNVTAMIVLARNYAINGNNLDRAVVLAERAVSQLEHLKQQPAPPQYTTAQWQQYVANTDANARSILDYARGVRAQTTAP